MGTTQGAGKVLKRDLVYMALVSAIAVAVSTRLNAHWLTVAITALHVAFIAQAWNLVAGYSGQLSMGHALFYGVGAYTSSVLLLKAGITPWVGWVLGGILASVVGIAVSLLVFRYSIKGIYFTLVTLALGMIAKGVADNVDYTGSSVGLLLPLKNDPSMFLFTERLPYFYIAIAMVICLVIVTRLLEFSKLGHYLTAIREDPDAAEACGIDTLKYKTLAMTLSAFFTAMAGTFYMQFFLYISPEIVFGFDVSMHGVYGTLVGGPGTVYGPLVGSLVFSAVSELLRVILSATSKAAAVSRMIYAAMLILTVLFLPGGLAGLSRVRKKGAPSGRRFSFPVAGRQHAKRVDRG